MKNGQGPGGIRQDGCCGIRDLIAARDARLNGREPRKPGEPGKLAWARRQNRNTARRANPGIPNPI